MDITQEDIDKHLAWEKEMGRTLCDDHSTVLPCMECIKFDKEYKEAMIGRKIMRKKMPMVEKELEIEASKYVWVVYRNTDLTEGRGSQIPIEVCESESMAIRLSKGVCVQGSNGQVKKCIAVYVEGSWLAPVIIGKPTSRDDKNDEVLNKKREALDKAKSLGLSDEEISLLRGV